FFFQAEDGIRDLTVTGVQTCALPICPLLEAKDDDVRDVAFEALGGMGPKAKAAIPALIEMLNDGDRGPSAARALGRIGKDAVPRSEERRVGKEGRARGGGEQERKTKK